MKDNFFENLKRTASEANNATDVITFAQALKKAIPRRQWLPIRNSISKECSVSNSYILAFLNTPELLKPGRRGSITPIVKEKILAYLLQQKAECEANIENANALITKINNFDN